MADIRKSYLNWPEYDDDLVNKIYVDSQIENIAGCDLSDIKKAVEKNTKDINIANQGITNLNNTKLNTETYDTFIEEEYAPLVEKVESTVENVDVEYYLSDSNLTPIGGSWSTTAPPWTNGKYMWSRQKITYVDGTHTISNVTCIAGAIGPQGPKGEDGESGTSIDSLVEEYATSTSKTTAPTSGWSTAQPVWSDTYYIWTRTKIVYKNPSSIEYTTPVCSTINDVYEDLSIKINGKIESYYQSSDPSVSWITAVEKESHIGDIWYNISNQKTMVYYKDTSVNPPVYKWQWQNVPIELIDSVNGKATIFSGVIPANYKAGDYWIIPLECYNNTHNITSQSGDYSIGMELKLGPYTLTVTGVNASHNITSYTINVPSTSNYSIANVYSNDSLELTVSSVSNFTLPDNCYGGSICIANSNNTQYLSSDWIPRNDYVPEDLAGRFSLAEDVNIYIASLDGKIDNNYSELNNNISINYSNLDEKIDNNYNTLDDKVNGNYTDLDDKIGNVNTKTDNIDIKYDSIINGPEGVKTSIQRLEDRLVANIRGTGGNNLLQNSVGFRDKLYWTIPSANTIEQQYKTFTGQIVTIYFRYRKSDYNNVKVVLGEYVNDVFNEIYTILNTSTQVTEWTDVQFQYTSTINNPVLRFNSEFVGVQNNEAESNGSSGSMLQFTNGLFITDLMIGYGEKQPWTPYFNEVYGKTYNLDEYGLDIRENASDKYCHLDANSLDFRTSQGAIESEFSKSRSSTDNIYIANSINIGNLNIIKLNDDNIIEY